MRRSSRQGLYRVIRGLRATEKKIKKINEEMRCISKTTQQLNKAVLEACFTASHIVGDFIFLLIFFVPPICFLGYSLYEAVSFLTKIIAQMLF